MNPKTSSILAENFNPLVSVIIPTYNRCLLLQEAIASVMAQTYTNWELIIVDDGSTDDTVETIRKINDYRIHLIAVPHKGHLGILRNIGVVNSKGDWLAFLDSDDLWLPQKLEKQLKVLNQEKKRWIYGGSQLINENKKIIPHKTKSGNLVPGWIVEEVINTSIDFSPSSLVIEKKFFNEVGQFTEERELFCREDHELTLRLAFHAEAAVITEAIVLVREHEGRTTNMLWDGHEKSAAVYHAFLRYNKDKNFEKLAYKRLAFLLSEASIRRFARGEFAIGMQQLRRSIWMGDKLSHWLLSFKRGIYAICKKYLYHSANKRKAKNVSAYHT
ncbi:MAG TPA: glycosyltransferase family 2 protein [Chitinophagaceae bacterium]|jgi:glycosyltransferase involved in cell wall biosynthesis|nr:glycosyltransferase family 2 protein [Chitinophagaceae bacterium]